MADMMIPNNNKPGNHENSTAPLGGMKGAVHGPNQTDMGSRVNGTMPTTGMMGAVVPPNNMSKAPIGHSSMS